MTTISEIMTYFVENRAKDLPSSSLAEVFDKLIWCLSDNGKEICEVRRKWLKGDCLTKVEIALNMTETFPFDSREEMIEVFKEIKSKWGHLRQLCSETIKNWDEERKGGRRGEQ